MAISVVIQSHLNQLKQHPHVDEIMEIKPYVYKVTYWPRSLESLYAQIPYTLKLSIPETYPDKPPFITFLDPIYHLNIHPSTGQLSMSILTQDWSPFLNLKAIISSIDQILQQPDQTHPASKQLLEQYQNDIPTYVQNVKLVLQKRINNNNAQQDNYNHHSRQQQQQHQQIYTASYQQQQVQSVIEVDDFSEYKINTHNNNKQPAAIILSSSPQPSTKTNNVSKSLQLLDLQRHDDKVKQHNYSFNNDADEVGDRRSIGQQQSIKNKEKMSMGRSSKHDGDSVGEEGRLLTVQGSNVSNNNNSKRKSPGVISLIYNNNPNNNNSQQITQPKYKTSLNPPPQKSTRKLPLQQDNHQLSYERLKQNMVRCKQLITIFSTELNEMQQNIEESKSKRIKKLLQEKCDKLEQMIVELFEINQKTQVKLMELVRDGYRQYL